MQMFQRWCELTKRLKGKLEASKNPLEMFSMKKAERNVKKKEMMIRNTKVRNVRREGEVSYAIFREGTVSNFILC